MAWRNMWLIQMLFLIVLRAFGEDKRPEPTIQVLVTLY